MLSRRSPKFNHPYATTEFTKEAIELAKENPGLGVGVHLVLTTGKPPLDTHQTIVDDQGKFKFTVYSFDETVDLEEVYQEWKAQIDSIIKHIPITHLDSHHHSHLSPYLEGVVQRLNKEYNVPYRGLFTNLPDQVALFGNFFAQGVRVETLLNLCTKKKYNVVDIMTHPAYIDEHLKGISSYVDERAIEREILSSSDLRKQIEDLGVEIISYRDL